MGFEGLGDLIVSFATDALFTAGGTHIDYEFWDEYCVYNPTRFAFPNLILENCFFGMSGAIPASIS